MIVSAKKSKQEYNFGLNSSDDDEDYSGRLSNKTLNNSLNIKHDEDEEEDVLYDQNKRFLQNTKTKSSKTNIS
jgi:hypothetical protein